MPNGENFAALPGAGELAEALTNEERIRQVYDGLDLDRLLHKFAFCEPVSDEDPQVVDEDRVSDALLVYALHISYIATNNATTDLDVGLIKGAFDHVYNGMDSAIEVKLGNPNRPSVLDRLLAKVIKRNDAHIPKQHMVRLNDRFWYEQLPREMAEQTYVTRQPEDTDAGYAARHVYHTLYSRVFSIFSYAPQATRFA